MNVKAYYQYVDDVNTGKVRVGKLVKLAVSRFEAFLLRDDMEFREDEADAVIEFFSILKHFKGRHAGKPFNLEPWQQFAIACIYGFYWRNGGRVTRNVYIEVARKNGKTAFAGGLCLYHLIADGEAGAEVDLAANSKEQAKISFEFASKFARALNGKKKKYLETFRDSIIFESMDSKMKVFAAEAATLDGYDASMYLLDEYHAARDNDLRDVLRSSQASRENPLEVIITTAGFDKMGVCFDYRSTCLDVLNNLAIDDSLFALIYCLDDEDISGDGWKDPANWVKCNPNLGITVKEAFLHSQVQKAVIDPSAEIGIKTKTFNIWCDTSKTWIPYQNIVDSTSDKKFEDVVVLNQDVCYGGIDLSSTSDLTALAVVMPRDGYLHIWVDYFVPREALVTKKLKEKYKEWERQGYLTVTPGNVTDYEYILQVLREKDKAGWLKAVGYDSWNATQFVISATDAGIPMEPYGQNIGNFNRPTKELERLFLSGRVVLHNNPITRFCLSNVEIRRDSNGNEKPDKSNPDKKIDGVIAILEALGICLANPYRAHGI